MKTLLDKTVKDGAGGNHYSCEANGRQVVIARAQPGFIVSYTEPFVSAHLKTKEDVLQFKAQINPQKPHKYYPEQPKLREISPPPPNFAGSSRPSDMPGFEDEHEILGRPAAQVGNPAFGVGEADLYPLGKYPSLEPGMPSASGGMHPTPFGQSPQYNQRWDPPMPGAPDPRDPTTGVDSLARGFTPKGGPRGGGGPGFPGNFGGPPGPGGFGGGFI